MDSKQSTRQGGGGRRRFLKNAAALVGLAAGGIRPAVAQSVAPEPREPLPKDLHGYRERSRFEKSRRMGSLGLWVPADGPSRDYGFRTPLQDSVGITTPASLHFVLSHGYDPIDIDP